MIICVAIIQDQLEEWIVLVGRLVVLTTASSLAFPFAGDFLLIARVVILRDRIQSEFTGGIDTQGIEDIDVLLVLRDLKRRQSRTRLSNPIDLPQVCRKSVHSSRFHP